MNTEAKRKMVRDAWRVAASALSFRIEAPYLIRATNGKQIPCVAFLPDFGSANGMVIGLICDPTYTLDICDPILDKELALAADSHETFYTYINPQIYERYDEEIFKEALVDWGYFGDEIRRPNWLQKPANDQ
jgi:hypothetical protein